MKVAYGYTVVENDPFIGVAEESAKISGWALTPGRWLVDYYPIGRLRLRIISPSGLLKPFSVSVRFLPLWFPFAGFRRQGEEWRQKLESLSEVPHQWVKTQMVGYD